jgi:periplasmic protein CpxP/Spy
MRNRIITTVATLAAATVVAFSGAALAQPGHHHGGPGQGPDFVHVFMALKSQLNLNTSQQAMWDAAVAQSKSARDAGRANFDKVRTAMTAELAKPEPDLAAVAAVADDAQAANTALRKQIRGQWLALYATFTPDQKAVVKDALNKRVARMEKFREKMMQRQGG